MPQLQPPLWIRISRNNCNKHNHHDSTFRLPRLCIYSTTSTKQAPPPQHNTTQTTSNTTTAAPSSSELKSNIHKDYSVNGKNNKKTCWNNQLTKTTSSCTLPDGQNTLYNTKLQKKGKGHNLGLSLVWTSLGLLVISRRAPLRTHRMLCRRSSKTTRNQAKRRSATTFVSAVL